MSLVDIPEEFGDWSKLYSRFNDWSRQNKLERLFELMVVAPDLEWEFIDGSIVKGHQHSAGAAKGTENAIGRSVVGNSTKIHLAVDSFGLPLCFEFTGREVHDFKVAPELIEKLPSSAV
jgi:hypothetical protein